METAFDIAGKGSPRPEALSSPSTSLFGSRKDKLPKLSGSRHAGGIILKRQTTSLLLPFNAVTPPCAHKNVVSLVHNLDLRKCWRIWQVLGWEYWSGRPDSNRGPLAPKAKRATRLRYATPN